VSTLILLETSTAGCWVVDETYYPKSKYDLIMFIIATREGDKQKAQEMVDQGRILSCSS
jgi:hypothetical protein